MRRFTVSFAVILCLKTAALSGQLLAQKPAQIPKMGTTAAQEEAEDSPDTIAHNQIFYNSPRTPEPRVSEPAGTVSAATISVDQLQHPLSRKGAGLLRQAQNFSAMGDHARAIEELQLALKERSAIPYAHSLLGTEYLRTNQVPAAIEALEQAVKMLPRTAVNYANLGYALFLMGSVERAEVELRRALDLDRNNEKTRRVLSIVTHANLDAK